MTDLRSVVNAAGGDPDRLRRLVESLSDDEVLAVLEDWSPGPGQVPPEGEWGIWLFLAGRGAGKTRAGAEWVKNRVRELAPSVSGTVRGGMVAPTLDDVRSVMVEGDSGLLSILPPSMLVNGSVEDSWNRGPCELRLDTGSGVAFVRGYSAERARRLRGPQHHVVWIDEPAEFRDARLGLGEDTTAAMALIGLRLPPDPRMVVTGTPKNVRLIRDLLAHPSTVRTTATTYDNLHNLGDDYRARVIDRYEGTRLGRQELYAELLEEAGGAFSRDWFPIVDEPLGGRLIRGWDLAATEPSDSNPDPDWTVGALVAWDPDAQAPGGRRGMLQVRHVARWRAGPGSTQDRFLEMCREDRLARTVMEQEPGSSGKGLVSAYNRAARGVCRVDGVAPTGSKLVRAEVWSSLAEQGRVSLLAGDWIPSFLDEVDEFPLGGHDDQVDAVSLAAGWLTGRSAGRRVVKRQEGRIPVGSGLPGVSLR